MVTISRRTMLAGSLAIPALGMARFAWAQAGEVTISHYFTGELGLKAFNEQVAKFTAATGIAVKESPVGHEDFRNGGDFDALGRDATVAAEMTDQPDRRIPGLCGFAAAGDVERRADFAAAERAFDGGAVAIGHRQGPQVDDMAFAGRREMLQPVGNFLQEGADEGGEISGHRPIP